jgi:hypothetical protein
LAVFPRRVDPLQQFYARQIGRVSGKDIVQEGTDNNAGAAIGR